MQIAIEKTLDVEVVERQLAELWKQTAGHHDADDETAVLRARVANLLVFVENDTGFAEVRGMMTELTARHPSRVLIMHGAREDEDRDIEMSVESFCQTDKRSGAKRLCCEEVSLKATGRFVAELPSAALPLLVPDLSTFLWWRTAPRTDDKVFIKLLRATDRLVVDSAEFADPHRDLIDTNRIYSDDQLDHVGVSDLNWARLTFWRGLLADLYDVPAYRAQLGNIDHVQIDYVAPARKQTSVAPQALLLAGWLASRLGWELAPNQSVQDQDKKNIVNFTGKDNQAITFELKRVERGERKPGRLVQVELRSGASSFKVERSEDNLRLLTEARLETTTQRGRVLPVRNRSAAQLLSREMEILCNDQIYQEALAVAGQMIGSVAG